MSDIFIYSGAGNRFAVLDGRDGGYLPGVDAIKDICARCCTDGLMVLRQSDTADFRMEYFNSDGSGGMMCGNGGRCIVAFAACLGIVPSASSGEYVFEAPDAVHRAKILSRDGSLCQVRLQMKDVCGIRHYPELSVPGAGGGWYLDTGTRHYVLRVPDAGLTDVDTLGRAIRNAVEFAPVGVNADFVSVMEDGSLNLRTFEKGVEGETSACGTGAVAAAIVCGGPEVKIHAIGGDLDVCFIPVADGARDVYLSGPAELAGKVKNQ